MSTVVDIVVADKNLSTLLKTVQAAGMETALSKEGPFTVLAPSEIAFGKLVRGELVELLKPENKIKLTSLLTGHVIQGKKSFKDFTNGQKLQSMDGKELDVSVINGRVTVNGAAILGRDYEASNGVVHSLDRVIRHD